MVWYSLYQEVYEYFDFNGIKLNNIKLLHTTSLVQAASKSQICIYRGYFNYEARSISVNLNEFEHHAHIALFDANLTLATTLITSHWILQSQPDCKLQNIIFGINAHQAITMQKKCNNTKSKAKTVGILLCIVLKGSVLVFSAQDQFSLLRMDICTGKKCFELKYTNIQQCIVCT